MKTIKRPANAPIDCWNHIGVAGDGSCPELGTVGHCRDCPVYGDAVSGFFDRPAPDEYRQDWAAILRKTKEVQNDASNSMMIFQAADEWLALRTTLLREVMDNRAIHRIPHRSNPVLLGLVNVRGEIQLCISLAGLLGIEHGSSTPSSRNNSNCRMIVAEHEREIWVFPVEKIHGTQRVLSSSIGNSPSTVERAATRFTRGVIQLDGLQVGLLDDEALFAALKRDLA